LARHAGDREVVDAAAGVRRPDAAPSQRAEQGRIDRHRRLRVPTAAQENDQEIKRE
jgi:hypothetical protein